MDTFRRTAHMHTLICCSSALLKRNFITSQQKNLSNSVQHNRQAVNTRDGNNTVEGLTDFKQQPPQQPNDAQLALPGAFDSQPPRSMSRCGTGRCFVLVAVGVEEVVSPRKGRSLSCTISHASPCQLHGGGDDDGNGEVHDTVTVESLLGPGQRKHYDVTREDRSNQLTQKQGTLKLILI
jgi:hypothetical protein